MLAGLCPSDVPKRSFTGSWEALKRHASACPVSGLVVWIQSHGDSELVAKGCLTYRDGKATLELVSGSFLNRAVNL
jgi:hypothetical protein